ncbi:hypothetical protein DH2020_031994 [Rehmannia glutinosa]|uniref:Tetratricopeptide repeat protein 5 OB fold domain-containing protein n=1 Tax=Rehmannia glutinosa TaxID=99300 RepID=A0ABR0VGG5_REHGL
MTSFPYPEFFAAFLDFLLDAATFFATLVVSHAALTTDLQVSAQEPHRFKPKNFPFLMLASVPPRVFPPSDKDREWSDSTHREIIENAEDLFAEASKAVDALYTIRDTYFPTNPDDKTSKLLAESNLALQVLDEIPPEKRKTPVQRATYEYLRGKILDVFPSTRKKQKIIYPRLSVITMPFFLTPRDNFEDNNSDCKDYLLPFKYLMQLEFFFFVVNGVKLNPSLADAWLSLGAENQVKIVDDSINHAKEAITLDVKDGNSWYNLGNACLTSFFVTGAWDHGKLLQSLKAYQHAVNKYLENYERALSGFEAAALKDPGLSAMEEVQKIVRLLDKIESLLRGQIKFKRLASLASSLSSVDLNASYRRETVDHLLEGLNKAVAIVGRVLFFVKHENVAPFYYLLCDSSQSCYVLSVYGIHNEAIKEGDQVTLLEPSYRSVDFSWKGKSYQFRSVRVDFLEQVLVNGKMLPPQHSVQTSIYAQNKT